jgi:uncharacterized protein YndB with AHSA1/START domain
VTEDRSAAFGNIIQLGSPGGPAGFGSPPAHTGLEHFDAREGERALPALHGAGAMPVARDRWERLETVIQLPYPAATVWRALTEPDRLAKWLAVSVGSFLMTDRDMVLDFEDGEYFLVRPVEVKAPRLLRYYARWLGIGQITSVTWRLEDIGVGTLVRVIEEATNPPWDWQTWNGGGWPGILEQLAAHLRTGLSWRWPWRRMGPYVQAELPVPVYVAWDQLFGPNRLKYWLIARSGELAAGGTLPIMMGDASGTLDMTVDEVVGPGQAPPSFLPHVNYRLRRPAWQCDVAGRLWLEPAGWGKCLLQAFHYNWEALPGDLQKSERRILTGYWAESARRAQQVFEFNSRPAAPHNW